MIKRRIASIAFILAILSSFVILPPMAKAADVAWYDAAWPYRLEITIDHTKVDDDLAFFPVLITEEDMTATFWAQVQNDGEDIVVTSDDGETKLRRELVSIDTVGEEMELWFRAPSLSSTVDDIFYLYFGNAVAAEVNSEYTWDTNYMAVYHMNDDPDNAHIIDSTDNGLDGTKEAVDSPIEATELIGKAQDFNGSNHIDCSNSALSRPAKITVEVLTKIETINQWHHLIDNTGDNNHLNGYRFTVTNANELRFRIRGDDNVLYAVYSPGTYAAGTDYYFVGTYDEVDLSIYAGGIYLDKVSPGKSIQYTTSIFDIGYRWAVGASLNGLIDEVRISNIAREAEWISTTYNTMTDPAGFYSTSEEALTSPTVVTHNAEVTENTATLNGEITALGVPTDIDYVGFVWGTTSQGDPGDTAPDASAYDDDWSESGSFGLETFDYDATELDELTTYYFRACAHSDAGWAYGDELSFFALAGDEVYIELRPDLDETRIRGNAGIPSDAQVGIYNGYSLPIWDSDNEELYFLIHIPDRWDGESNLPIEVVSALAAANESGHDYQLQFAWEHVTPNEEEIPITSNLIYATRHVASDTQYECYRDWFTVDYDIDAGDSLEAGDILALRLRRIAAGGQLVDLDNELIVLQVGVLFARGDLLGDPDGAGGIMTLINLLIDTDILIGGVSLILLALALLALGLTVTMFMSRNAMLGFPCVIMWAILGGYCYTQSTTPWGDWQYYLAFASLLGMTTFCAFGAFGLREKRDTIGDDDMEHGDSGKYIDEGDKEKDVYLDEDTPRTSARSRRVQERAAKRRSGTTRKGEFDY